MRWIKALGRSFVLLALAIAGPIAFALVMVGLVFVLSAPPVILAVRRLPELARRLAGVSSENVYWAPPRPLEPEPDGSYLVEDRYVRNVWWYEFERRLDWVTDDHGSRRDLIWMLTNPVVGGALAAAAPGLVGFGVWLLFTSWWPASILPAVAGLWAAPHEKR